MVEHSAAELPGDAVHNWCQQPSMGCSSAGGGLPHGYAMPQNSRALGKVVRDRWHLLWSFLRKCHGKPFMRSTTSGTLLRSCPEGLPVHRKVSCTTGIGLEEHTRTSKRNLFFLQCPSSALYWQSLTSHQLAKDCLQVYRSSFIITEQTKEGQIWSWTAINL